MGYTQSIIYFTGYFNMEVSCYLRNHFIILTKSIEMAKDLKLKHKKKLKHFRNVREVKKRIDELFDENRNKTTDELTKNAIYHRIAKEFGYSFETVKSYRFYDVDKLEEEYLKQYEPKNTL